MYWFPGIDGIFLLDDMIGFIGDQQCREYVVPYFKRIFSTFNASVRMLHNDADGRVSAGYLPEMGVNLFNPSYKHSIEEILELTGRKVTILGNIPPRDVLAAGTPEGVQESVMQSVSGLEDLSRIILSCGGGVPQNVSTANLKAFITTAGSINTSESVQQTHPRRSSIISVAEDSTHTVSDDEKSE